MILSNRLTATEFPVQLVSSTLDNTSGTSITFPSTTAGDIGVILTTRGNQTITGWTRIETQTVGGLFVKDMTAGETSATTSGTQEVIIAAFFRGALLPTTSNSDTFFDTGGTGTPNPPVAPVSVNRFDAVIVCGALFDASVDAANSVSSGYNVIQFGNNGSYGCAMGFAVGNVGTPNPAAFPWSASTEATGMILVLKKA